jgi:LruC domain-containing protein
VVTPDRSMKNLSIPVGFDFSVGSSVSIRVVLPATTDYSTVKRVIEIWDSNSDGYPGKRIRTVLAANDGTFESTISFPEPTKKLFTRCFAGWRGVTLLGDEDGLPKVIDYNTGYEHQSPHARQGLLDPTTDAVKSINPVLTLEGTNSLKNPDFSVKTMIPQSTWWSKMSVDSTWHAIDGAVDFGTFEAEEGHTFARIENNNFITGGFTQLIDAHAGEVVTFSGDARGFDSQQDIYLFLVPRNAAGDTISTVSCNLANPGIDWTHAAVTATMPPGTASCQVMFFSGATGAVDFSNAFALVTDPSMDEDGDQVIDLEDSYPENPEEAFNDYYPAPDKMATLAFEDTWPNLSDFDYNDLVVDYRIKRIMNALSQVVEINFISQVRAVGTTNNSGFGFQLLISPDLVEGISNNYPGTTAMKLVATGTEMDQTYATFILFDEGDKTFVHTQENSPTINTTMGYYFVVPDQYIFKIFFKEPIGYQNTSLSKFNPFIFDSNDRSKEIHLPGHEPTDLADQSLFGTGDDATNMASGRYYVSSNGLPWALNTPVMFDYPLEGTDLLKGYLMFDKWVGGQTKYTDWYLDKAGYRNWDAIYHW